MACSHEFRAVHNSGTRSLSEIRWVVMHDEEAPTARAAASWFKNPDSAGSAHVCVDNKECYRTLPDSYIAWAAPGANTYGLHLEQAGWASWNRKTWLKNIATLRRSSTIAARWCVKYKIRPRFVHADGLRAGRHGVTTHAECTKAFGGTHTDPGAGWPRRVFMTMVRTKVAALKLARRKG